MLKRMANFIATDIKENIQRFYFASHDFRLVGQFLLPAAAAAVAVVS